MLIFLIKRFSKSTESFNVLKYLSAFRNKNQMRFIRIWALRANWNSGTIVYWEITSMQFFIILTFYHSKNRHRINKLYIDVLFWRCFVARVLFIVIRQVTGKSPSDNSIISNFEPFADFSFNCFSGPVFI